MSKNSNATRVQPKYCSVKVCSASHIKCTEGEIFLKMYFQETFELKHFIPHPTFFVKQSPWCQVGLLLNQQIPLYFQRYSKLFLSSGFIFIFSPPSAHLKWHLKLPQLPSFMAFKSALGQNQAKYSSIPWLLTS